MEQWQRAGSYALDRSVKSTEQWISGLHSEEAFIRESCK